VREKPVVRRRQANEDIDSAINYYWHEAGADLALAFTNELEKVIRRISKQPGAGSPRFVHEVGIPALRHAAMGRFPYLIFYLENESRIEVLRVLHSKMDIPSWLDESYLGEQ